MDMNIRSSSQKDFDGLLELWKEFAKDPHSIDRPIPTHAENIRRQRELIGKLVDEDPRQVQVAEQNGILVGYLMCQRIGRSTLEMAYKWGHISDLYVKRTHRRQGIGRKLLQTALEYLKSVGNEHVRLAVWQGNEGAIKLYRELGFRDHVHVLQIDL
jgi:ribosomal protein S18 acetylase RimI-like enzyme